MIFAIPRCKALNAAYFAKQNSRVRKAYGRLLAAHSRVKKNLCNSILLCLGFIIVFLMCIHILRSFDLLS